MISYDPDGHMIFPGLAPGTISGCIKSTPAARQQQRCSRTNGRPDARSAHGHDDPAVSTSPPPGPPWPVCWPLWTQFGKVGSPIPFDISAIQESAELSDQPAHCRHASEASRPRHVSFRGIMPLAAEAPG